MVYTLSQQDPNPKYYKIDRASALLSFNRALWGEVSPKLRCAKILWDKSTIRLFFYYDGDISEEDHESSECAATEVIADFPEHQLDVQIIRLDHPKPIPKEGETV